MTSLHQLTAEVSQGKLQYPVRFRRKVARLTGMEVANASLYEGAQPAPRRVMMDNSVTGSSKGGAVGRGS